jgi:serine protease AprX
LQFRNEPVKHPLREILGQTVFAAALLLLAVVTLWPAAGSPRLDAALRQRARHPGGRSQVIIRAAVGPGRHPDAIDATVRRLGGESVRALAAHSRVAMIPDVALTRLAADPDILSVSLDRPVAATDMLDPNAGTTSVEAAWLRDNLGVDGSGVGVATIDSGVNATHDDLATGHIVHWADFVTHQPVAYDDYGHGTHVAGIIAGTGADSTGARRGIAPGADLVVLKALDGTGNGRVSDVIDAVDYAIANRDRFNIKVINLSVAAGVYESCYTDPLAQAALRATRAGIVVIAAAGNLGLQPNGQPQYGSIAAPGNAPWVLTVGASDDRGTADRRDDVVAGFSSRGPAAIDGTPKPDVIAPGVGIESTADPGSTLFSIQPRGRVWGTARTVSQPYLRLSGTSMAAPAVTATVALMVQTSARLTPNEIKAIIQFTADPRAGVDQFTQGSGLLNVRGAVALAQHLANPRSGAAALEQIAGGTRAWSRQIIWGARRVNGDTLPDSLPAWDLDVTWGAEATPSGEPVTWERLCSSGGAGCGAAR